MGRFTDAARAAWSEVRKARPPIASQSATNTAGIANLSARQPNTAVAPAQWARQMDQGLAGFGAGPIPPEVEQALRDQGMQTSGAFAPGRPINQFFPQGMPPRQWDYPVGYNVGSRPRSNERGRLSFETLKSVIDNWDVARLCIQHRERDIRSLDWRIVPREGVEDDVADQVAAARRFFTKPDGVTPFDSWQNRLLEDMLRYDAATIYRNRTRDGRLGALDVVSGPTVAPLVDYYGRRPRPPAPAFVQFVSGVPALWLASDVLIYEPFTPQPESPYGLPPMEWLLLTANTDLRFQWHFLQYFTENNAPGTFMEAPPDQSDPEQIVKFQAAWDAVMEGDQSQLHKVKWVPAGSNPQMHPDKKFDPTFPLYLMRKTAAAFGVTPHDLGFVEDVNRSTGETQVDVQFRIGTQPILRWLQGIYSRVIEEDLLLPDVEFEFDTGGEKEDRLAEAQAHQLYVMMGAESPDEVRQNVLGLEVDAENPVPRFVMGQRTGPIPLKSIEEIAGPIDPNTVAPESGSVELADLTPGEFASPNGVIAQPEDLRAQQAAAQAPSPDAGTGAALPPAETAEAVGKALGRWRANSALRVAQGLPPRRFRGEWAQAERVDVPRVAIVGIWSQLEKATDAEEVDAAFRLPFVKAAPEPPPGRPLRDQQIAAEEHYADAVVRVLTGTADATILAAEWLARQPVRKAGPTVLGIDLLAAATEYLGGRSFGFGGLASVLRGLYADGWRLGIGVALDMLRGRGLPGASTDPAAGIDWGSWTPGSAEAASQARGLADLLAQADVTIRDISDTTLERLAGLLAEGAARGDAVDTIAHSLADLLGDRGRALTIAWTELSRAQSAASLATYEFNGIEGKSWLTYSPCPICQRNEAVGVIPLNASFPGGVAAPPQHPRCRCALRPESRP